MSIPSFVHTLAAFAAAATLLIGASVAHADVGGADPPEHIYRARTLLHDARRLDAAAERGERQAQRLMGRAGEKVQRAQLLRRHAARMHGLQRVRILARADDLEVEAAILMASARHSATGAQQLRAEARRVRLHAKRRAATPVPGSTAARSASLSIASTRPCAVKIDGMSVGYSPQARIRLAPGSHRVSCTSLDGRTITRTIRLQPHTSQRITFAPAKLINPFE